ncbi:MAG: hypothetical protein ACD_42C00027G0004, partial [uncultured bacterium]
MSTIKTKIIFTCGHCDAQYNKWQGQPSVPATVRQKHVR